MSVPATILVVAKAPVPGLAKTRLARVVGDQRAAEIAAASLLDTLDAVLAAHVAFRVVAMTGDLAKAARSEEVRALLEHFTVIGQKGDGLGERLVNAHNDTYALTHTAVFQIGMDTPQVTGELLTGSAQLITGSTSVLGPAADGGWWGLGVPNSGIAQSIRDVPMSSDDTFRATQEALEATGTTVHLLPQLRDVDFAEDLEPVAAQCLENSRFAAVIERG